MIALHRRRLIRDKPFPFLLCNMISSATLFGFSIFPAGIAGVFRYHRNIRVYLPFLLCIWIGCINELISFVLWIKGYHTGLNNNIYVLAEAVLFLFFFKKADLFENRKIFFRLLLLSVILVWAVENLLFFKILSVSSLFRFYYSLIIVLLSTTLLSRLLVMDSYTVKGFCDYDIFKRPSFWIAVGAIIFFLFKIQVEIFWFYGLRRSAAFRIRIYNILMYVNFGTNLIYTLAILWMPRKLPFTMRL